MELAHLLEHVDIEFVGLDHLLLELQGELPGQRLFLLLLLLFLELAEGSL